MKVQFMSDLHDKYPTLNEPSAPILALLGDIGNPKSTAYRAFLLHVSALFEDVIVIAGNHEYYGNTLEETKTYIMDACKNAGTNVHFLDRTTITLHGIRFIGATLWSDITKSAAETISCFKRIYEDKSIPNAFQKLRQETYLEMHRKDLKFIEDEIATRPYEPCVILTHYAPLMECNGCYNDSPQVSAFATDLQHLYKNENVKAHLFGHTHVNGNWTVNNVPILCNCKGYYPGECQGLPFDVQKRIEV